MDMSKLALCLICKGVDSEAEVLDRCLEYAHKAVDKIFITVTHEKGTEPSQKVYDVCNKYKAVTSKFEWIKDFAAARNFNFSQVSKDFTHIFWLDADDVLRDKTDLDNKKSSLKTTIDAHPEADVFSMFYLYAFDEHKNATVVHQKTRVVKNDGCVEWFGDGIHEDFKENRELVRLAIKDIEVLHLSTDTRLKDSRERNFDIAENWIKIHPNARAYWNLANSAYGVGRYEEALGYFDTFIEKSGSDEEKYIARLRCGECFWALGNNKKALEEAQFALGLRPEYPDAYHLCGKFLYDLGQFERAKDMFINGLTRPAPKYKILVYNPREYDYLPLMNLAKCYYSMNLPQLALPAFEAAIKIVPADAYLRKTIKLLKKEAKDGDELITYLAKLVKITDKEKLKKALDKVPLKYKYHPMVLRVKNQHFVKETSNGKDIVFFCGFTEEEFTPESIAKKGSGGSEEALITVTQGLADKGWNVTVYNSCGTEESLQGKVKYIPYMAWNYKDKQDVVVLWRNVKPLDWEINAPKVFVDMHDVVPAGEFTSNRISRVTKVFFKSQYHKSLYPQIPDAKTVVIPNGIWTEDFKEMEKDPLLMINTSSPVRSLTALIDIMKEVRKEVPEAKMKWAYGWTVTDGGMKNDADYPAWKKKTIEGMKEAGIEDIGRLTHKQITELYNKASLFIYPTGFPEIDCISLTKAIAANCYPITTDYAALGEKQGYGEFIHWPYGHEMFSTWDMSAEAEEVKKQFVGAIIVKLLNPPQSTNKFAFQNYDWNVIIEKWDKLCTN